MGSTFWSWQWVPSSGPIPLWDLPCPTSSLARKLQLPLPLCYFSTLFFCLSLYCTVIIITCNNLHIISTWCVEVQYYGLGVNRGSLADWLLKDVGQVTAPELSLLHKADEDDDRYLTGVSLGLHDWMHVKYISWHVALRRSVFLVSFLLLSSSSSRLPKGKTTFTSLYG